MISKQISKILVMGTLFTSCASIDGLEVDKSFTYQSLGQRGLIISEVMSPDSIKLDDVNQNQLKGLLESEVRDEREDFQLAHAESKLFNDTVLQEFKQTGGLSSKTLKLLPKLRNYVAYGIVSNDSTSQQEKEEKDDKDNIVSYIYSTSRQMTVSFKVYDLESSKLVWSGDVNKSLNESKKYNKKEHRRLLASNNTVDTINAIGGLAGALTGKKQDDPILDNYTLHPKAPSQRDTLKDLFEDFADSLPKKGLFD